MGSNNSMIGGAQATQQQQPFGNFQQPFGSPPRQDNQVHSTPGFLDPTPGTQPWTPPQQAQGQPNPSPMSTMAHMMARRPASPQPNIFQQAPRQTSEMVGNAKSPLYQQLLGQAQAAQAGTYRQGFSDTQQGLLESLGGPTMPTVAPAPATTPGPTNRVASQAIERNLAALAARQSAPPPTPEAPTPFNDISVKTALGPMTWQNAAARGYMSPHQLAQMMADKGANFQEAMNAVMPIYQQRIGTNPNPGTSPQVTWTPRG